MDRIKGTYLHPQMIVELLRWCDKLNIAKHSAIVVQYAKDLNFKECAINDNVTLVQYKESLSEKNKLEATITNKNIKDVENGNDMYEEKIAELQRQHAKEIEAKDKIIEVKDGKIKRRDDRIAYKDDKIDTLIKDIKEQKDMIKSQSIKMDSQSSDIQEQKAMIKELLADGKETKIVVKKTKKIVKDIKSNLDDLSPLVRKYFTNEEQKKDKQELIAVLNLREIYDYPSKDTDAHIRIICGQPTHVTPECNEHIKEAKKYGITANIVKYKNISNTKGVFNLIKNQFPRKFKYCDGSITTSQYGEITQALTFINDKTHGSSWREDSLHSS